MRKTIVITVLLLTIILSVGILVANSTCTPTISFTNIDRQNLNEFANDDSQSVQELIELAYQNTVAETADFQSSVELVLAAYLCTEENCEPTQLGVDIVTYPEYDCIISRTDTIGYNAKSEYQFHFSEQIVTLETFPERKLSLRQPSWDALGVHLDDALETALGHAGQKNGDIYTVTILRSFDSWNVRIYNSEELSDSSIPELEFAIGYVSGEIIEA